MRRSVCHDCKRAFKKFTNFGLTFTAREMRERRRELEEERLRALEEQIRRKEADNRALEARFRETYAPYPQEVIRYDDPNGRRR